MQELIHSYISNKSLSEGISDNTSKSYKSDLEHFTSYLKTKKVHKPIGISKSLIMRYFETLKSDDIKNSSFARKVSAVKGFILYLIDMNIISENPISSYKPPKKEMQLPKFLTDDEIHKIINAINEEHFPKNYLQFKCLFMMMYHSGMRVSEAVKLPLSAIKYKYIDGKVSDIQNYIIITGKGNKERMIPISDETINDIKKYLASRIDQKSKYLFNSRDHHLTRQTAWMWIKKATMLAGIDISKVSPHKLRHSIAVHLIKNGMDVRLLQEILGHEDISTTSIYTELNNDEITKLVHNHHPLQQENQ
jgi:integrase/recombinase XerD